MATVGNLQVRMTARTAPFRKDMQRAGRSVKKFQGTAVTAQRAIGALGAVAAGIGVRGLSRMVTETISNLDAQVKFARLLGTSADALRALQHAAELSGVATSALNMGLQRMVRRVAEAAAGTGEAKDALKQLGVNAEEVAKLRADQQFLVIADALAQVTGQSERVRLAFKLFDSEGVKILNLASQGSDAIRAMGTEFIQLAGSVQGAESQIEAANDAMTRLGVRWQRVKQDLAIGAAGGISDLEFALGKESGSLNIGDLFKFTGAGAIAMGFREIAATAADLREHITGISRVDLSDLPDRTNAFVDAAREGVATLHPLQRFSVEVFQKAGEAQQGLRTDVEEMTKDLNFQADAWDMTAEAAQRMAFKASGATDEMLGPLDAAIDRMRKLRDEFNKAAEDRSAFMRDEFRAESIIRAIETPGETLKRELSRIFDLEGKHLTGDQAERARQAARARFRDATMGEPFEMADVQRSVSASVQTAIGNLNIAPSQDRRMERLEERQEKHLEDIEEHTRDMADVFRGITLLN